MKNRILSMILTIVVLIGMVPAMSLTAFAAETNVASVTIDGTTTNYTDLASAFTAARDATGTSVTLTLLEDVTTEESISVTGGKFTFDLNGKTLQNTETIVMFVDSDVELSIKDSGTGGTIESLGDSSAAIMNNGSLTIESGTIKSAHTAINDGGSLVINGGMIDGAEYSVYIGNSGSTVIHNGTFKGSVWGFAGYTVNNGTFEEGSIGINAENGVLEIKGGTFNINQIGIYKGTVSLSGGNFKNGINVTDEMFDSDAQQYASSLLADGYAYYDANGDVIIVEDTASAVSGEVTVNAAQAATPTPIGVSLEATKAFNDWSKAESFTFILEPVTAGAPMPASNTAVATEPAPLASFGNITFESEGTYKYTIIEVDDGIPGITYDKTGHEVVVTVTRGADNSLTASVKYDGKDGLVITNTYMKPAYIAAVDVADGTELQGATIQLLDEQGDIVDEWVSTVEAHEVLGLIAGEIYTVHNTVAPIGYTIATDTQFRLDQYGNVISTGSVDQYGVILVEFAMTEVSIAVVDIADSAKLEGATVQIFDLNGDLVEEWVSTTEAYEVIGLETNKVHTVRTIVTPNGYDIPTDVQFTLDGNGNITCTGSVTEDGVILVVLERALSNVASVTIGGNTTNYTDLEEAFDAAAGASGSTLTLLDNISRDKAIAVTSGNFTVDLNGKTWECTNGRVIDLQNDAKLRIVDGSTNKNGKLLASNNGTPAISMRNNAELEIAGGTVESMTSNAVDMSFSGNATSAKLVISGGKLITNGNVTIFAFGSSITITGGTFEHNDSNSAAHIYFRTGAVDLSGHPDPSGIDICIVHVNGDVTLGEDTINLPDGYVMLDYYGEAQTTLANGYLYEVGKATVPVDPEVKWGASADALTNNGTLAEAIAANAAYIQLQKDITSDSILYFQNSVTIDLNGKVLTAADGPYGVFGLDDLTITDSSEAKSGRLSATATNEGDSGVGVQGIITVKGGTLSGTGDDYGVFGGGSIIVTGGSLTGEGGTGVWVPGGITVSGGSLSGTGTGENNGYGVFAGALVTVENDGKITATGATAVQITNETGSSYSVESETIDAATGLTTVVLVAKAATSTYTVTVNSAENGTVTADKTEAAEGETVTLTVTPADGYVIDTFIVTDADGYVIHDDTPYFTMPAYNVIVKVTFAPEPQITDIYVPEGTPGYDPETKEFVITPENPLIFVWEGVSLHLMPDEWQILLAGLSQNDPVCGPAYAFTSNVTETKVTFNVNLSHCLSVLSYIDGSYIGKTVDFSQENAQLSDVKLYYSYVTVEQGENGTISVPYGMDPGESATITVTPDAGYVLDTLTVTDADGNPVTVENNTFIVPAGGATVEATFKISYATKAEFDEAIADLEEKIADQIDPDEFAEAIKNVIDLIDALDDTYAADAQVTADIEAAKKAVTDACTKALDDAVKSLEEKIVAQVDPDELTAEIEKVTNLINALDDAYATDDQLAQAVATTKSALEALIGGVQSDLDATQGKLDKAIEDLNKAIADGDKDLSDEIAALNTALTNAKAVLEKADADNKVELAKKVENADKALDEAIKAVEKALNDLCAQLEAKDDALAKANADNREALESKDAELQMYISIAYIIAGIAICGCSVIAVLYFTDKKKKA